MIPHFHTVALNVHGHKSKQLIKEEMTVGKYSFQIDTRTFWRQLISFETRTHLPRVAQIGFTCFIQYKCHLRAMICVCLIVFFVHLVLEWMFGRNLEKSCKKKEKKKDEEKTERISLSNAGLCLGWLIMTIIYDSMWSRWRCPVITRILGGSSVSIE